MGVLARYSNSEQLLRLAAGAASTFDVRGTPYHPNEIDDGAVAIGPLYAANFEPWLDGEPIENQDVVIWYAAHFTHNVRAEPPGEHGHIVDPTLKQVSW